MDIQSEEAPLHELKGGGAGDQAGDKSSSDNSRSALRLEDHITVEQISQLMQGFYPQGWKGKAQKMAKLTKENFKAAFSKALNIPGEDEWLELLCNKISSGEEGFIQGYEFCSYMLQLLQEKDSLSNIHPLPFQDSPKFRHNMSSKETLCRLFSPRSQPPRYISVSKDGSVGIWNQALSFQTGFTVDRGTLRTPAHQKSKNTNLWVTDCAILQDCNKLVLSTTARELLFYDTSTTVYKCQYNVHDIPSVPLCISYHSCSTMQTSTSSASYLLFGDTSGSVHIITFSNPHEGLFQSSGVEVQDRPQLIAYLHLNEHAQLLSVQCMAHVHPDWITHISYIWHNHSFISCSNSPSHSLVIKDIGENRDDYIFKMKKGVTCFDYCHQLEILVTGSIDHALCVWDPYVSTKPIAVLTAHSTAVLDVLIASDIGLIFSYSYNALLCAWDIYEHVLVQKIMIRFPFSQRLPEYGPSIFNLFTHTQHPTLTILCNNIVTEIELGVALSGSASVEGITSHNHPLCAATYNPFYHQVVSACEDGVVTIWDVDSGDQILKLIDCHGNNEITALSIDATGRRLITGSRAGDIKVWNYMDKACLKHMVGSGYSEVTGVMHMLDRGKFLSVGWNKRITTFLDQPDIYNVKPDSCWKGVQSHHSDDILCVDYCPPYYLATGSFDGEIKVWNLDTEKIVSRFQSISKLKPSMLASLRSHSSLAKSQQSSVVSSRNSTSSRPASRRLSSYRIRSSTTHVQNVPVDQLHFLKTRFRGHQKGTAMLVSSEGGVARFWDIFGDAKPLGCFPMTESEDENVLALGIDPQDHYLLTGDTAGTIAVFNIKDYCVSSYDNNGDLLQASYRWQGHSAEILSIEFISQHDSQALVLSASADCTVRLWTIAGHYIGVFGQKQPWNLNNPSSFQHPNTPCGEPYKPTSCLSRIIDKLSPAHSPAATNTATISTNRPPASHSNPNPTTYIPSLHEDEVLYEGDLSESLTNSSASVSKQSSLPPTFYDKSLGSNYDNSIHKRMVSRQDRRTQYAGIDMRATQRFGSLCSPFQALQILNFEDVHLPKEMVTMSHKPE